MLLTIVQAPPPVPRKAADDTARARADIQKNGDYNQTNPSATPTSLKADGNGPAGGQSEEQHYDNAQHAIQISKLPPVSVKRDWADWGGWLFSGLLAVTGVFQILLLQLTWKTIKRQTEIQAFGMVQWVNVENWKAEKVIWVELEGRNVLNVSFDIVNPTHWPMEAMVRIDIIKPTSEHVDLTSVERIFLAPSQPHTLRLELWLSESEVILYENPKECLLIPIDCSVSYESILRDGRLKQRIRGVLLCGGGLETKFQMQSIMTPFRDSHPASWEN